MQPPLSLYIHFPWCVQKCPYCDFNSHEACTIDEERYIDALLADFEQDKHLWQGRELHSIFMGGGTPSLFSAHALNRLLSALAEKLAFRKDMEITLEANPGTFEQQKFAGYFAAGINRLSIGIQSFNDRHLQALGRIHNGAEAIKAIEALHQAGFTNFNIDLMHGLPQQTKEEAFQDLQTAFALNPGHLSWYQLTIEPNTVFYSHPPRLPKDETLWEIQEQGQRLIANAGFQQYEVSAYSKPGQQSQHNLNYWQFGDYLALGAGAHGKITNIDTQIITRYQKTRTPKDYLDNAKPFTAASDVVASSDLAFEFFMNGFRLNRGVRKQDFIHFTGLDMDTISDAIETAKNRQLIIETEQFWQPTEKGRLYLNDLLQLFL
ncbi:MAG: YggW family oxidoreductase [Gammaproteobacteria bacterium]|nr:MAG: YggW family oxidoreductase [Gammaproteobacteria bacterium]